MIVRATDKVPVTMQPGVVRAMLGHGERLMLVEVHLDAGSTVPEHSHPHEQVSYVVRGTLQFTLSGEEFVLSAGESCFIPAHAPHAVEALVESTVVDAFSPPREDFA